MQPTQYDNVVRLTSRALHDFDKSRILNDFASELGWRPSYRLDVPTVSDIANAHLVVEHGLENTAIITFLRSPRRFIDLSHAERRNLLSISYNNLVDWHIHIEADEVNFVFNRTDPPRVVEKYQISRDNFDKLRSEAFEQVTGKKPNPNLPALDNALIETISFWKRNLSAEMHYVIPNESLSSLFNAIIFVRAAEDNFRRSNLSYHAQDSDSSQILLDVLNRADASSITLRNIIFQSLARFIRENIPEYLINESQLHIFDALDRGTVFALFSDFYRNKYAPYYEYDFSLMSKHALSRIYEHYVSILRLEESPQTSLPLFPRLPEEERNKAYGSFYTPQFIARFFARYLQEQMPPLAYQRLRTTDPACGSGIFLRTLLELQCDPTQGRVTTELIQTAFENILGLDVDENACQATRLSLSLLHLVLTNDLPRNLNVTTNEAIEYFQEHPELKGTYDVVIANPPFVSWDTQSQSMRERIVQFMREHTSWAGEAFLGRIDMYLAFLQIGLELLKPGGYGLFVLPHSFLLKKSASRMRKRLSETSWIRCLADLSAIRVFEDTGSYIILLIFQKQPNTGQKAPPATIIKCQDLVGPALQDAVEGRRLENNFYSIYDVEQDTFAASFELTKQALDRLKSRVSSSETMEKLKRLKGNYSNKEELLKTVDEVLEKNSSNELKSLILEHTTFENEWLILPPTEATIKRKFRELPTIGDFMVVRQGLITGADNIFILSGEQIPSGEESLFVPFLPDREMRLYRVPKETRRYVFYPYVNGRKITEEELRKSFPLTWRYLSIHKDKLQARSPVQKGQLSWWQPVRPRQPDHLMRPKIISPHLVLVPRFALDREGKYAISHAPLLYPKEITEGDEWAGAEDDLLRYFVAILNSSACYWYISSHSHLYGNGYVMLEPKTLAKTPVPDPRQIPPMLLRRLLGLVDRRLQLAGSSALEIEKQIDQLVASFYGLTVEECLVLGI